MKMKTRNIRQKCFLFWEYTHPPFWWVGKNGVLMGCFKYLLISPTSIVTRCFDMGCEYDCKKTPPPPPCAYWVTVESVVFYSYMIFVYILSHNTWCCPWATHAHRNGSASSSRTPHVIYRGSRQRRLIVVQASHLRKGFGGTRQRHNRVLQRVRNGSLHIVHNRVVIVGN